jgi:hypothetical protein
MQKLGGGGVQEAGFDGRAGVVVDARQHYNSQVVSS